MGRIGIGCRPRREAAKDRAAGPGEEGNISIARDRRNGWREPVGPKRSELVQLKRRELGEYSDIGVIVQLIIDY